MTVASEEERKEILQRAKNVEESKKCKLKTIFLKRDMTPLERQELSARHQAAAERGKGRTAATRSPGRVNDGEG